jgi:hypothetical protein
MKRVMIVTLAVVLTGCAGNYAVYRHPQTGDRLACERSASPTAALGVFGGIVSGNAYADCKNELESRGYVRDGSVSAEPMTRYITDVAKPVPVPNTH